MARRTDYSQVAARYDEDRAQWSIPPDPLIAELVARGQVPSVLDIGCGTGRDLHAQQGHFGRDAAAWSGVDPSREMSQIAAAKTGAPVCNGRAEALPVRTGSVDYAFSSFCFHHFIDKDAALDELARVLRVGGRFRLRNIDPWSQRDWWIYQVFDGTWEADGERFWAPERIVAGLDTRGFAVEWSVRTGEARAVGDLLAEAERRVVSQLAILDDVAYAAGLGRLRALTPRSTLPPGSTLEIVATRL